jgi:hypothetical protein
VSRASGVPLARSEFAFWVNFLLALAAGAVSVDLAFFFVAMLLFPPRRLRQNDGRVFSLHAPDRQGRGGHSGEKKAEN